MKRAVLTLALVVSGCTRPLPPGTPCTVGAAAAIPAFPASDLWQLGSIPQPAGAWIGGVAISPDGREAVYANSIGGNFIPAGEGVSLIRIDLGAADPNHTLIELPGEALRNHANLSWSAPGLAWASWSTLGTAQPRTAKVRALHTIPKYAKQRPTFPLFTSVVWAAGGDCVAATIEKEDRSRELVAWKAAGASSASHRVAIAPGETIAAWNGNGILLLRHGTSGTPTARWLDPASGTAKEAPAPPAEAQASAFVGDGWLWVDGSGVVSHGTTKVAEVPRVLVPKARAATPTTVAAPLDAQTHRFYRLIPAESGRAIAVEEGVTGPGIHERQVHVLTLRRP